MEINENIIEQPQEQQGQSFNQKEQELIQQLIKTRRENKQELTFENLDGYEVPPRTQFSMLRKPAVTFKLGKMEFNCAAVRLFEGIFQILPTVNPTKKRLAAVPCPEEETSSVEWSRKKKEVTVSKTITSVDFVEKIFNLMGWDRTCRYKILGKLANSERGLILVFDFTEAIMFAPKPVEYTDTETGKVKKKQVKYYPDIYKYRIGKSYKDYSEAHQQSIFENLEEYSGTGNAATEFVGAVNPDAQNINIDNGG